MTETHERGLRLSRQVYRLRLFGFAVGAVAVAAVLRDHGAPWQAWVVLAFNVLVWPNAAYLAARRSADPHKVERTSLTIDSALGGFWVAVMHFNLLPSVLIVTMMSMDKLGWGPAWSLDESLRMTAEWHRAHAEDSASAPRVTARQIAAYQEAALGAAR